jgi:transposase InsO family protein
VLLSGVGDPITVPHEALVENQETLRDLLDVDLSHSNVLHAITASLSRDCDDITVVSDAPESWKQDCCFTAGAIPESSTPWVVDSGATCHISPWKGDFVSIYRAEGTIKLGDKSTVDVIGRGNINLALRLTLSEARLAPKIRLRLFSISRFLDDQRIPTTVSFSNRDHGRIMQGNRLLALIRRCGNLHVLEPVDQACISDESKDDPVAAAILRHRRFGHPGKIPIRRLGLPLPKHFNCNVCDASKLHRNAYKKRQKYASRPLESVHTDMSGTLPRGLAGERYYSAALDEHSRYVFVGIFRHKSEAATWFVNLLRREQRQLSLTVLRVHSDNGSELCTTEVYEFCESEGIVLTTSPAYDPASNGLVERIHKTLMERSRCLLQESGLPETFWPFSLLAATEKYNSLPHSKLNWRCPAELYRNKSFLNDLQSRQRVFGCAALVYPKKDDPIVPSKLKKVLRPSLSGIYLSSPTSTTIEVFLPEMGKIKIFHDFKLDENCFPALILGGMTADSPESDYEPSEACQSSDESDNERLKAGQQNSRKRKLANKPKPKNKKRQKSGSTADDEAEVSPAPRVSSPKVRQSRRLLSVPVKNYNEDSDADCSYAAEELIQEFTKEPKSVYEALADPRWKASVHEEFNALADLETFEDVSVEDVPKDAELLPLTWIFKCKRDENGEVSRLKSRLCVRGNLETRLEDVSLYAPVLKRESLRYLFDLAVHRSFNLHQCDISNAFLQSSMTYDVYLQDVPGFPAPRGFIRKLKRSLYGLRIAARLWNLEITKFLTELGLRQSPVCSSLARRF